MRDHLLGFHALASLIASQHAGRAPQFTAPASRFTAEEQSARKALDIPLATPRSGGPRIPGGWFKHKPFVPGWYTVGSEHMCYREDHIRAYFNGTRWVRWVGMVDPSVRATFPSDEAILQKKGFAWQRHLPDCAEAA